MKDRGAWTYIDRESKFFHSACRRLGRDPKKVALKIWKEPLVGQFSDYRWGGGWGFPIQDCTRMQNVAWYTGRAARVYAVAYNRVNKGTPDESLLVHQLVEYLEGEEGGSTIDVIASEISPFGAIFSEILPDHKPHQFIDGKLVDFQIIGVDETLYANKVIELLNENVWGFLYQSVPELGIEAHRFSMHRVEDMHLHDIDFKGKTVLDIGCSNGQFCNYAHNRGAKRVVGLDFPKVVEAAFHLSNYVGNHNIDYHGVDLKLENHESLAKMIGIDEFDYVFFLSMGVHVGFFDYLHKFTKNTLFYERSGGKLPPWYVSAETAFFRQFRMNEHLGLSSDKQRDLYRVIK